MARALRPVADETVAIGHSDLRQGLGVDHLLGIDHTRLIFRFSGRDMRLTDVYGEVVKDILA